MGASAAFFVTSALKVANFGSLLTVGFSYGFGIILAIVICVRCCRRFEYGFADSLSLSSQGPASGGHLSPCYTIAFWLFKGTSHSRSLFRRCSQSPGFPAKKVPFYIGAQIFGAFLGALTVYGVYKQVSRSCLPLVDPADETSVATRRDHSSPHGCRRSRSHLYSARGEPLSTLSRQTGLTHCFAACRTLRSRHQPRPKALLRLPQRVHRQHRPLHRRLLRPRLEQRLCPILLCSLPHRTRSSLPLSPFRSLTSLSGLHGDDLGLRCRFYRSQYRSRPRRSVRRSLLLGRQRLLPSEIHRSRLPCASLLPLPPRADPTIVTNILATLIGAAIQTLLLSDSARPTVTKLPDPEGPSLRAITRDAPSMRAISREEKGSKDSHRE